MTNVLSKRKWPGKEALGLEGQISERATSDTSGLIEQHRF